MSTISRGSQGFAMGGQGSGSGQAPTTYKVQSGDTLWDIAADHHVSLGELLMANPQIQNPDLIAIGQVIHLPRHRVPSRVPKMPAVGGHAAGIGHGVAGSGQGAGAGKPKRMVQPAAGVPKWFQIAADEERHFAAGRQMMYHKQSGVGSFGQDWCSVFANWVMQRVGYTGTMSALASSWMKWGIELKEPRRGAIVVLDDGFMNDPTAPNNPYFHVAFVDSCGRGSLRCLGGNQSCAVTYASYQLHGGPVRKGSPRQFHFRWPPR